MNPILHFNNTPSSLRARQTLRNTVLNKRLGSSKIIPDSCGTCLFRMLPFWAPRPGTAGPLLLNSWEKCNRETVNLWALFEPLFFFNPKTVRITLLLSLSATLMKPYSPALYGRDGLLSSSSTSWWLHESPSCISSHPSTPTQVTLEQIQTLSSFRTLWTPHDPTLHFRLWCRSPYQPRAELGWFAPEANLNLGVWAGEPAGHSFEWDFDQAVSAPVPSFP